MPSDAPERAPHSRPFAFAWPERVEWARAVIVGFHGRSGFDALFPYPIKSRGGILCHRMFEMAGSSYITTFDRVNLCVSTNVTHEIARHRARIIREAFRGGIIIMLGEDVALAFDLPYHPGMIIHDDIEGEGMTTFASLPSPVIGRAPTPDEIAVTKKTLERLGLS